MLPLNRRLFFDGAMGTMLQLKGIPPSRYAEELNIDSPELIRSIHAAYLAAGADILKTNTFGANSLKAQRSRYSSEELISAAIANAKDAISQVGGKERFIAMDIGPTGKLLAPMGDLKFEESYNIFKEMAICGERHGADLILIETMNDLYELKSAVLASVENTRLPVIATVTVDSSGRLLTGGSIDCAVALLEDLGVTALGINCAVGPAQILPFCRTLLERTSLPVVLNPNAGLPSAPTEDADCMGSYDTSPEEFAALMRECALMGANILGGCCGTSPEYIKELVKACSHLPFVPVMQKTFTAVSSYSVFTEIGVDTKIGEKINPSDLRREISEGDIDGIIDAAFDQLEDGFEIISINLSLDGINEKELMISAITALQEVISAPLQILSSDPEVLKAAHRIYNGKPLLRLL